jgi:carbamoyl-phosphate synthase large subunit
VPFVSKATGVSLAKVAARCMAGVTLREQGMMREVVPKHFFVKEAVFPFIKFPGVDTVLGPEMKSTGEVMGIDHSFGLAFAKSQMAAGFKMPLAGRVFLSVHDHYKERIVPVAEAFARMGFRICATRGTAERLREHGVEAETVLKVNEGRPHVVDRIKNGDIQLVINLSLGRRSSRDAYHIRRGTLLYNVLYTTTISGARALVEAIGDLQKEPWDVAPLQDYHRKEGDSALFPPSFLHPRTG